MALHPSPAARALQFMQQCRTRRQIPTPSITSHIAIRTVSSSHLAPSNFSKQTRRRDNDIEYPPRFNKTRTHNLPLKRHPAPASSSLDPNYAVPPGFLNFVKYRLLNLTPPPPEPYKPPPFNVLNNPYRAKKKWPPDFDAMHPKQQFHFEKTFRRRMLMKTNSSRYNWNRYIRLLQQSLIIITFVYFIFIADPYSEDGGGTPVDGFRGWFFGQVAKLEHLPGGLRDSAEELEAYYKRNWKKAPWNEDQNGEEVEQAGDEVKKSTT